MFKQTLRIIVTIAILSCSTATFASTEQAQQFVTKLSTNTLAIIKSSQASNTEKEQQLTELFKKTIDTEWIGKFALGRYIRTMTPEQKQRYQTIYSQFLILNYVPNFRKYTGQTLKINSVTDTGNNQYLVQTEIVNQDGPSTRVDYRLRQKGDDFKIYDIIGEGISLITTQRAEFGSILSQQGVDSLIGQLEARVKAGSGAPVSASGKTVQP